MAEYAQDFERRFKHKEYTGAWHGVVMLDTEDEHEAALYLAKMIRQTGIPARIGRTAAGGYFGRVACTIVFVPIALNEEHGKLWDEHKLTWLCEKIEATPREFMGVVGQYEQAGHNANKKPIDDDNLGEETLRKLRERGVFEMEDKDYIEFLEAVIDHTYHANGTPETDTCEMCQAAYGFIHYKRLPDNWESLRAMIEAVPNKIHIGDHWK